MPVTVPLFSPEDLEDPMKIEAYSNELLETADDGSARVRKDAAQEIAFLFQNKWIGMPHYAQTYARDWVNSPELMKQMSADLDLCKTLEEATEAVLTHLKLWGRQVAADFVGAFCFLEAQSEAASGNDEIIKEVRATDKAYAGYIAKHEQDLSSNPDSGLEPGDALYIAQPLLQAAPGFMKWLFGVVDISLLNRRQLLQESLMGEDFNEVTLRILLASNGVIEEAALFGAYFAHVLNLHQYYSHRRLIT